MHTLEQLHREKYKQKQYVHNNTNIFYFVSCCAERKFPHVNKNVSLYRYLPIHCDAAGRQLSDFQLGFFPRLAIPKKLLIGIYLLES